MIRGGIGQCGECGALVSACPDCGNVPSCPYCTLGISPTRSSAALARQVRTPRRRSPGRAVRQAAQQPQREREPSFLERVTGLTGDHLAVVGLGAIAALARASRDVSGDPTVRPRFTVVDGEWREVP